MADYTNSAFPRYDMMGTDARGCMLGDAGLLVVADAFLKGIKCFDYEKAYEIALLSSKALTERNGKPFEPVRTGEESYIKDAFVSYAPVNEWSDNHSLSQTLEYPYISKMYLNGKEIKRSYLTYSEITAGGKLTYILSKEPDLTFGKELPGSFLEQE